MIKYLKDQYLAVIITVIFIFFTLNNQNKNDILIEKTKKLESDILVLEEKAKESTTIIDSLSKIDTVIVNRIKTIKQKEYVQIRIIDSLPTNKLQSYFTDRYKEE
jgi:hypothetical protein